MLSREYIRTTATGEGERLWRLYGFTSPGELVLEDVALARGVVVFDGALDAMEARLIRRGDHGLIRVNGKIPEVGRKRFAIAHELGHWELHKRVSQLFACTGDDMVATYKASVEESQANYFASGLLMPEFLFADRMKGAAFSFQALSGLASLFSASLTATAMRYVDLSDVPVALVVSAKGRVRWWRGSDDFEDRFWVNAGALLAKCTLAYALQDGHSRDIGPDGVKIGCWSERGEEEGSGEFIEQSLYMPNYGQVLTLLELP